MPLRCAVVGCDTVEEASKKVAVPIFNFPPPGFDTYEEWVARTGRKAAWRPGDEDGVCALHIRRSDGIPTKCLPNTAIEDEKLWDVKYLEKISGALWTSPILAELAGGGGGSGGGLSARLDRLPANERAEVERVAKMMGEPPQGFLDRLLTYYDLMAQLKRQRPRYQLPRWVRLVGASRELAGASAGGGGASRGGAGPAWEHLARQVTLGAELGGERGAVWRRAVRLARARLALLAAVGDDAGALAPAARPAFTVEDVVLLQAGDEERVALPGDTCARAVTRVALATLFELVWQFQLEEEGAGPAPRTRWEAALKAYRARHRHASLVLLQRRWYELRRAVHASPADPDLHRTVVARMPHLAAAPPPSWRAALDAGRVYVGEVPEPPEPPAPPRLTPPPIAVLGDDEPRDSDADEDDDVVIVEKRVDTFEISDDEDGAPPLPPPPPSPPPIIITEIKSEVHMDLTRIARVVLRDVTTVPGWNLRRGRYVSLTELALEELAPPAPRAPPPRPSFASRLMFEEDDVEAVLASSSVGNATLEISFEEEERPPPDDTKLEHERESRRVRLPDIEQVRRNLRTMLTAEVSPTVAGAEKSAPAPAPSSKWMGCGAVCCWALRDRLANAARVRNSAAARRAPPALRLPYHEVHCRPPCRCCCRAAQWGWAGAALAFKQQALDRRLEALDAAPASSTAPGPASARARPLPRRRRHAPSRSKKRRREQRMKRPAPPPAASPLRDPLQEWIRQKNINNRFFDLNLQPPPAKRALGAAPHAELAPTTNIPTMTVSDDEDRPAPVSAPAPAPAPAPVPAPVPARALVPTPVLTVGPGPQIIPASASLAALPRGPAPPSAPAPLLTTLLAAPRPPPVVGPRAPVNIVTLSHSSSKTPSAPVLVIRPMTTTNITTKVVPAPRPAAPAAPHTTGQTHQKGAEGGPGPAPALDWFLAVACADEEPVQEGAVPSASVRWAGRPLVVGVSAGAAAWGPLLGWYVVSARRPEPPPRDPLDWWVAQGGRLARVAPCPPPDVRPLWALRSARQAAREARAGAPLLALQAGGARALRVSVRRAGRVLLVACAYHLLAQRIARAFNEAEAEGPARDADDEGPARDADDEGPARDTEPVDVDDD